MTRPAPDVDSFAPTLPTQGRSRDGLYRVRRADELIGQVPDGVARADRRADDDSGVQAAQT